MEKYRYPGPRPFQESDFNLFFGRERDTANLVTFVNVEQLTVLFAKSGLGKSSLINAAVIPRLKEKGWETTTARFNGYSAKEQSHNLSPLSKLVTELEAKYNLPPTFLDDLLPAGRGTSLWHFFKNLQINSDPDKTFFVFFDQFEELFTYPEQDIVEFKVALAELLNAGVPKLYSDLLKKAKTEDGGVKLDNDQVNMIYNAPSLNILFTIRSDKFSLLTKLKDKIPTIVTKTYELKAFSNTEAREAIISPAALSGDFVSNTYTYSEDALGIMLKYLTAGNTNEIESFQLQVLCRYVEDKVIAAAKGGNVIKEITAEVLGNIKNVFEEYYNNLIASIDADKVQKVKRLFEDGLIFDKDKMRLTLYESQISQAYGVDYDLLGQLVNTHLLRAETDSRGTKYELSHDSLVEPILKAKEKRKVQEQFIKQRKKARSRVVYSAVGALTIVLSLIYFLYNAAHDRKLAADKVKFLSEAREWLYNLDPDQLNYAISNRNISIMCDDSVRFDSVITSFHYAAVANYNLDKDASLSLKIAMEAFSVDSNYVTDTILKKIIRANKGRFPLFRISCAARINNAAMVDSSIIAATNRGVFRYHANNGKLIDSLTGAGYQSDYSVFSRDGSYLVMEKVNGDSTMIMDVRHKSLSTPIVISRVRHPVIDPLDYYYSESGDESGPGKVNKPDSTRAVALDISFDNSFIVTTNGGNRIYKISLNGTRLDSFSVYDPSYPADKINILKLSPDAKYVSAGMSSLNFYLTELSGHELNHPFIMSGNQVSEITSISFLSDSVILTANNLNNVMVWDIKSRTFREAVSMGGVIPNQCRYASSSDSTILTGTASGLVSVFDKKQNAAGFDQSKDPSSEKLKYELAANYFGLDSTINDVSICGKSASKILATASNMIAVWNRASAISISLRSIKDSRLISLLTFNEKLNLDLVSDKNMLTLKSKKALLASIVYLDRVTQSLVITGDDVGESAYTDEGGPGVPIRNRHQVNHNTALIHRLYDRMLQVGDDTLSRTDDSTLYSLLLSSFQDRLLLGKDTLDGMPSKENLRGLITFTKRYFAFDTVQGTRYNQILSTYLVPLNDYFQYKRYDDLVDWTKEYNDSLRDVKDPEIKSYISLFDQYCIALLLLDNRDSAALQYFGECPNERKNTLSYMLTKYLLAAYTNSGFLINQDTLLKAAGEIDFNNTASSYSLGIMMGILPSIYTQNSSSLNDQVIKNLEAYEQALNKYISGIQAAE